MQLVALAIGGDPTAISVLIKKIMAALPIAVTTPVRPGVPEFDNAFQQLSNALGPTLATQLVRAAQMSNKTAGARMRFELVLAQNVAGDLETSANLAVDPMTIAEVDDWRSTVAQPETPHEPGSENGTKGRDERQGGVA
jgi:hypothetical protein